MGEIGIRMALGARPMQVVGLVLRGGLRLVLFGLGLGMAGAAGAALLIRALLFSAPPVDLPVYGAVAALFLAIGVLACLVPSLRASRVDPLVALRSP
jgi:ABC-type antimicrobial peptide transport system permease subunit